jgi:hypothetical protein
MTAEEIEKDAEEFDPLAAWRAANAPAAVAAAGTAHGEAQPPRPDAAMKLEAQLWWGRWDGVAEEPYEAYRANRTQQTHEQQRHKHDASKSSSSYAHERCV